MWMDCLTLLSSALLVIGIGEAIAAWTCTPVAARAARKRQFREFR
jgi:hypothetical protein